MALLGVVDSEVGLRSPASDIAGEKMKTEIKGWE